MVASRRVLPRRWNLICHVRHSSAQRKEGRIIWQGKAADVHDSGNPYVEQFIHGSAQGPIQMEVLRP